ncbi:hypothetical protein GA0070616_1345 [Micromonospora nigra]|uniref:Uncharacterized protein n=1 Tax=Micromonospora nigra TaxID=145857 RepID=A0A1C6RKU8_9ACTN|nr:hypothetical protein [Micromonospora nigra]SCL17728.1 hypothetical protein GA0070616_1345 [Micromonospora nigra]
MSSTPPTAGEHRLLLAESVPVLPACQLMLAALDADGPQVRHLIDRADPQALIASLMKLCAFMGVAAYGPHLRAQIAVLAADRDIHGEAGIDRV